PPRTKGSTRIPGLPRLFSWRGAYLLLPAGAIAAAIAMVLIVGTRGSTNIRTGGVAAKAEAPQASDQISDANRSFPANLERRPLPQDSFGTASGRVAAGGGGGRRATAANEPAVIDSLAALQPGRAEPERVAPRQPSVIRTATLRLVASDFNAA